MQLFETFTDNSTHVGNLFVTLKQVPHDAPRDDELHENKEQNYSEPWSEFP
jgi:hypothetical protein